MSILRLGPEEWQDMMDFADKKVIRERGVLKWPKGGKFKRGEEVLIMTGGRRRKYDSQLGTVIGYRPGGGAASSRYLVDVVGMKPTWIESEYLESELDTDHKVCKYVGLTNKGFFRQLPEIKQLEQDRAYFRYKEESSKLKGDLDSSESYAKKYLETDNLIRKKFEDFSQSV